MKEKKGFISRHRSDKRIHHNGRGRWGGGGGGGTGDSVDPDQLASEEANWSGSALFAIQYVNLYQQSGSRNLIGWQLQVGMVSYLAWRGLTLKALITKTADDILICLFYQNK